MDSDTILRVLKHSFTDDSSDAVLYRHLQTTAVMQYFTDIYRRQQ
jgi:hypothetical protein